MALPRTRTPTIWPLPLMSTSVSMILGLPISPPCSAQLAMDRVAVVRSSRVAPNSRQSHRWSSRTRFLWIADTWAKITGAHGNRRFQPIGGNDRYRDRRYLVQPWPPANVRSDWRHYSCCSGTRWTTSVIVGCSGGATRWTWSPGMPHDASDFALKASPTITWSWRAKTATPLGTRSWTRSGPRCARSSKAGSTTRISTPRSRRAGGSATWCNDAPPSRLRDAASQSR